jgi:adenylyltransferase/sulfurtransferase
MASDRYSRQRILPQIGAEGQERLGVARVLLVGCGALGSVVAETLVRGGVGFLRLVDRDLVELSNLQRQFLFEERDAIERIPKSVAAAERLGRVNSTVVIEPVVADVNAGNIEELASKIDLIVDGTDNLATRYLINDLAVKEGIPWIYGGCVGVEGRVLGVWPNVTACLRCLFPDPPQARDLPTCDTAGVLGPASVVVGGLQAAVAIRFLVKGEPSESSAIPSPPPEYQGRGKIGSTATMGLLSIDVWSGQFRSIAATIQEDCPCCGQREFPFLSTKESDFTTTLCGRQAVQVLGGRGSAKIDLVATAAKWQMAGEVQKSPWFIRCRLNDPAGIDLTLFPDGRLLVHGTHEPMRAKSIYARFVGE